jgi:hypothetical protein
MSNILVITQDSSTKTVTVIIAADNGVTGTFLSFTSALASSSDAVENKLFSGLASGKALVVREDSGNIIVLLADDPGLTGDFVAQSQSLSQVANAVSDALYAGL